MTTDLVRRVMRPENPDWIIHSLLDVDFYKFTMGYYIFTLHRGVSVTFSLINRNIRIPLAEIIDEGELRAQLDHAMSLRLRRTDIAYLRGQDVYGSNMFSEEYLRFLGNLQLTPYTLTRVGNQFELSFTGPWEVVTFWETIAMAIISELLYRTLMRSLSETELTVFFARATNRIYEMLLRIKTRPWIRLADFGTRRRFSFLWHQVVVQMCREILGKQFSGTSNTWMAFNQDLIPIGTNAHELPMVLTAIAEGDEAKRMAQYQVLREWQHLFPQGGLRITLPDTYGSEQFYKNMPKDLAFEVAHHWRGQRQDSGDPIKEGLNFVEWLSQQGVDAKKNEKVNISSDGLDVDLMFVIDDALRDHIADPFGVGTHLTNIVGCHPRPSERAVVNGRTLDLTNGELFRGHSFVCKVVSANGNPAVKLSNNVNKATGPKDEVEKYLKIFGHAGRVTQDVFV